MHPAAEGHIQVARTAEGCRVLGPGTRFVIWVQGCPLSCAGCIAEEWLSFEGGEAIPVQDLAAQIVASPEVDGVTFSGGEPFAQAGAVTSVIRAARALRPGLSTMSYSGYPIARLRARGTAEQLELLSLLDILVDGPYRASLHADLRWRGSSNQRVNFLTDRHRDVEQEPDVSAGIEFTVEPDSVMAWAGVPPVPEFRKRLDDALTARGLVLGKEA